MFDKVLIANRGEIALRVIRACHELGIKTVAVHSEEDRDAYHVRAADEAVDLGGGGNANNYLNIEKLLDVAEATGAEAVHPGYGFLSERPDFCRAADQRGLTFIGPKPESMEAMASKTMARKLCEENDIPLTPGSPALQDADDAEAWAEKIGYPVMLKAAYGGGGMGMIVVEEPKDLRKRFESASAQAQAAFGNGEMFMERFLTQPRHLEIQVLCDSHGNQLYVGERECSIQRRFQKLIEEAPSPVVTPEIREAMGEVSLRVAKAVDYVNAGTCEYIFQDGEFFFNEMNTRLQVEHPVTEMIYGIDLVEWQLRIAAGEELTIKQEDLEPRGWAIEARVNAENPFADFMPTPGPVATYHAPGGYGVRVDSHLYAGYTVPSSYDSLVCKLVAWGGTRQKAIDRLHRALGEYELGELTTNIPFHLEVLRDEPFTSGNYSTGYIRDSGIMDRMKEVEQEAQKKAQVKLAAALAGIEAATGIERHIRLSAAARRNGDRGRAKPASKWQQLGRKEAMRGGF